jgi:hypothetical protein
MCIDNRSGSVIDGGRAALMAKTWDDIRAIRFSKTDPPPDWPFGVRPISQDGLGLFDIVPASNKLFWDGREVVLRNRIRLSWRQGFLATVAAFGTFGTFLVEASQAGWWHSIIDAFRQLISGF